MGLLTPRRPRNRKSQEHVDKLELEYLVAAAVDIRAKAGKEYRSGLPPEQRQSLEFYDLVGEAWYPAQFYARMLSRVRLYVGKREANGEINEVKDNPEAQAILSRIQDAGGGTSQWKQQYGRLQFLIGDGFLIASLDDDGNEQWEYLSPAELVPEGRDTQGRMKYTRKPGPGANAITLYDVGELDNLTPDTCRVWRLWRKHPTHSELADSPMHAVNGLFAYLMLLDKAATAQALSRIVGAGLLVVDDRITIPAPDVEADDETATDDSFMKRLVDYIIRPIRNPGSASAVAPLVARVEAPEGMAVKDMVALIQLHDPNQTADWGAKIEKTITRIAIGLDMPPEEFLGLAQANHWTGWVITDEKWKAHGEPATIQLCEDLTAAYFRPACVENEVKDAASLVVWYDAAHVVTHPDRGKDALAVHEAGELSGEALRRYNSFSDGDAPDEVERQRYREFKLKTTERPDDPSEADSSGTGSDVQGGSPENNGDRTGQPSPQPGNQDMLVQGAAFFALERIRERAGNMLKQKKMRCEGCFKGTESVPNSALAAAVGPEVIATLGYESTEALVAGGAEPFVATLQKIGVSQERAKVLAAKLERYAADTLCETDVVLPEDFAVAA